MAKKRVVVLLRRSPLNLVKGSEALRHCVGLAMETQVTALLMGPAVWLALPLSPQLVGQGEVKKHLDFLPRLKGQVKAEREALERYGIPLDRVHPHIQVVGREEMGAELAQADAVIPF